MITRICLLLSLTAMLTPSAHAQSLADEADAHFGAAVSSYQSGHYNDALLHFMQSNRLSPNATVASNVGHTFVALKRYPEAYRWYSNALALATNDKIRSQLERTLKGIESKVVLFNLVSDPPGATVYVNRKSLGAVATTPAAIALSPGDYSFIFELDNHRSVTLDEAPFPSLGSKNEITASLETITGKVVIGGTDGVRVYDNVVEGKPLCTVPCAIDLPIGQRGLQFAKEGFRTQPSLISIEEGTTVHVDANPEMITGSVTIDATAPSALVTIDGEAAGFTPVIARAPIGKRTVVIQADGYATYTTELELKDGATLDLGTVNLQPKQFVTLASRVEEDLFTAPSSLSVVTRAEMDAFGYPTIAEALRGVRGLSVINADLTSMAMVRGIGTASNRGTQTKVLMNGVSLTDQLAGQQYLYSRSQNLESIEVQRGSGSVLYGSGALTGLVSLQTRGRIDDTRASASLGFFGSEARVNSLAASGTEDRGAWLSIGGTRGEGDPAILMHPQGGPFDNPETIQKYTPWRSLNLEAKAWSGDFEAWTQIASDTVEVTSGAEGTVLVNQAGDNVSNPTTLDQVTVGATYRPKLTDKTDLEFGLHYRQRTSSSPRNTWQRNTAGVNLETLVTQNTAARWVGGNAQLVSKPSDKLRLVAGGEFYRSLELSLRQDSRIFIGTDYNVDAEDPGYTNSVTAFSFKDAQAVYAVYGVADYQPHEMFKLSAGLRLDSWSKQSPQLNPRLVGMFLPSKDDTVKLMVGRAFRAPVTFEKKYFVESISVPATNLRAESGYSYELEYAHRFSEWTALASGWGATYKDVIISSIDPNAGGLTRYTNTNSDVETYSSDVYGFDAELRREFLGGSMFSGWYSYQKSTYINDSGDRVATPEQPNHLAALKVAVPISRPGVNAAMRIVYEGERPLNTPEGSGFPDTIKSAVLTDFILSGKNRSGSIGWRAGVYNALNTNFQAATVNSTTSPILPQTRGRTFMGSLEFTGRLKRDDT